MLHPHTTGHCSFLLLYMPSWGTKGQWSLHNHIKGRGVVGQRYCKDTQTLYCTSSAITLQSTSNFIISFFFGNTREGMEFKKKKICFWMDSGWNTVYSSLIKKQTKITGICLLSVLHTSLPHLGIGSPQNESDSCSESGGYIVFCT